MTTDTITRLTQAAEQAREALESCGVDYGDGSSGGVYFDPDAVADALTELTAAIEAVKEREAEPVDQIGWRIVIGTKTGFSKWVHYYDIDAGDCPLNRDGTWKEGHPHHWKFNDSPNKKLYLESVESVYTAPQPQVPAGMVLEDFQVWFDTMFRESGVDPVWLFDVFHQWSKYAAAPKKEG